MKKRIISAILTALLILSAFSAVAVADTPDFTGYTAISTKQQLAAIADDMYGKYYLTNDIVFEDADFLEGGAFYNDGNGFLPLGGISDPEDFAGILDGNGHGIKNLKMTPKITTEDLAYVGLFAMAHGGKVYNLYLDVDIEITLGGTARDSSDDYYVYAGAVAGCVQGHVKNCTVEGNISFVSSLTHDGVTTRHPAVRPSVGGICGANYSLLEDCTNNSTLTVDCEYKNFGNNKYAICTSIGGIAGENFNSSVKGCTNGGVINVATVESNTNGMVNNNIGGIVGRNLASIEDCSNNVAVTVEATGYKVDSYVGGIAGDGGNLVLRCNNLGDITVGTSSAQNKYGSPDDVARVGGIVGRSCVEIKNCSNSGKISVETVNGTAYAAGISCDVDSEVTDCQNRNKVVAYSTVGSAFAGGITAWSSATVSVCDNLGEIYATSDGDDAYAGGISAYNSEMTPCPIEKCVNYGKATAYGYRYAYSAGILACGDGKITRCYNVGEISGGGNRAYAGGIAGDASNCDISLCYNNGVVLANADTNDVYAGGIAAQIMGEGVGIHDCYNVGTVFATAYESANEAYCAGIVGYAITSGVTRCYNVGNITVMGPGRNYRDDIKGGGNVTVTDCFYKEQGGGGLGSDCATECTVEQLGRASTYKNFDFKTVWTMDFNDNYYFAKLRDIRHEGTPPCGSHEFGEYVYNNDATVDADGTKTRNCKKCGKGETVTAEGTKLDAPPPPPVPDPKPLSDTSVIFTDVQAGKWYKNAIDYSYQHKFISGMSKTEFGISTQITRGMFVTILARIAGVDTGTEANVSTPTKFGDVERGKYYTAAINWAHENGVANGMGGARFAPNDPIQRQQLAVMIVNFAKSQGVSLDASEGALAFSDNGSIAGWAKNAVTVCQRADIINGYNEQGGTTFKPTNTATRAEAAQILYKFHKDFVA